MPLTPTTDVRDPQTAAAERPGAPPTAERDRERDEDAHLTGMASGDDRR